MSRDQDCEGLVQVDGALKEDDERRIVKGLVHHRGSFAHHVSEERRERLVQTTCEVAGLKLRCLQNLATR
jgi:hypothetical protein